MSNIKSHSDNATGDSGSPGAIDGPPVPESAISLQEIKKTHAAYVRYLFHEDDGFEQGPTLSMAGQFIPQDAMAVSTGVYFLTPNQEDRLHSGTPPKVIQNECHDDSRVAYAIVAESDALETDVEVQTILDWLSTFAEDWIGTDEYSFYYSGNRSIHLHTEKFAPAEEVDNLRQLAEEFNETYDADLDTSIYKKNAQFRLIGAEHRKTGLYKTQITPNADRKKCIKNAQAPPEQKQWPFELPPPRHHDEETLTQLESKSPLSHSLPSHYRPGNDDVSSLPPEIERKVRRGVYKLGSMEAVKTGLENTGYAYPFSPYKKTGDEKDRSVILMEQVGGIRQNRRNSEIYVPAKIEYAIGGGDGSFTRANSESLVTLSLRDFRKWDFEVGDYVVIIGGNSGSSRLFGVEKTTAGLVALALEADGRRKALEFLSNRGFDVGSSGYNPSRFHDKCQNKGKSEAVKIKRGIENGNRERSYSNVFRVVCRLLRIDGYDAAYQWCKRIFGQDFDPEMTYEQLRGTVEMYDDYSHVCIPDGPEEVDQ